MGATGRSPWNRGLSLPRRCPQWPACAPAPAHSFTVFPGKHPRWLRNTLVQLQPLGQPGSDIANAPTQRTDELRMLASGPDFALLTVFVPGLANTLLVQLLRMPMTDRYSLYAVYREGNVTFDAIARFDIGDQAGCFKDLLEAFVQSSDFKTVVVRPIVSEVERHFDG